MGVPPARTDAALLAGARDGDAAAFRALVERYEGAVAATALGMLGPGDEADDVGQETFLRFHDALDRVRDAAAIRSYLTRTAVNLSLNALRSRRRRREGPLPGPDGGPPPAALVGDAREEAEARDRVERVRAALTTLTPEHRAVVILRLLEGYSTGETAAMLEIPEGTVMSRLKRALDRLESELRPWMDE